MRLLLGIEQSPDPFVGWSFYGEGLAVSGDTARGMADFHELAHFVLLRWSDPRRHHPLLLEGAASWAGGSGAGRDFTTQMRALDRHLRFRPRLTFREVATATYLRRGPASYPTGALLCQMAYERGGVAMVKRLLDAGPSYDDLLAGIERLLGVRAEDIDRVWRERASAYAAGG